VTQQEPPCARTIYHDAVGRAGVADLIDHIDEKPSDN